MDDIITFVGNYNTIYVLNKSNGELIWKYATNGRIYNPPTIDNDTLFVGFSIYPNAFIHALNRSTGELMWNYKIICGGRISSPTVVADRIFIGTRGIVSRECHPPPINNIIVLNKTNKELIWGFSTYGEDGTFVYSSPIVADGKVFVIGKILGGGVFRDRIYTFNESGKHWKLLTIIINIDANGSIDLYPMVIDELKLKLIPIFER